MNTGAGEMKDTEGLLDKAKKIRQGNPESNLSGQDQQDILEQIDKIVKQNRIQSGPELFKIHPTKKGIVMPVMINVLAITLAAGAILAMYWFFEANQKTIAREEVSLQSAEGKLLQEIKRQTESELAAKDLQLKNIADQLGQVQTERNNLNATLEEKVRQRMAVLQVQMQAAIEAERQRLRAQGYSEEEVERRLKEFEIRKNAEFNTTIAQYKKTLEQEKAKAEQELSKLEGQYSSQLSRLNKDREALADDYRQKEAELRQKLIDAENKQSNANSDALQKAQAASAQIEKLNEIRALEKNLDQQLSGFYSSINSQIAAKNYGQANQTIEKLQNFLRTNNLGSSESLSQKSALAQEMITLFLATIESQKNNANASSISKNASLIAEAELLRSSAREKAGRGDTLGASQVWQELLVMLPGAKEANEFNLSQEKQTAQNTLNQTKASFEAEVQKLRKQYADTATATEDRANLQAQLDAITQSNQEALAEKDKTISSLQAQAKLDSSQIKKLQNDLTIQNKVVLELQGNETKREKDLNQAQEAVNIAKAELKQARADLAAAKASQGNTVTNKTNDSPSDKDSSPKIEKLEKELALAQENALEYKNMLRLYQAYQNSLKALNPTSNKQDLAISKNLMETFFNSKELKTAFPGLMKTLQGYETALETAGQRSAIVKLNDRLFEISRMRSRDQQREAITKSIEAAKDSAVKEFYQNLLEFFPASN